jgi:hypothetical protein
MELVSDNTNLKEENSDQKPKKMNVKFKLGCQVQWLLTWTEVYETYMVVTNGVFWDVTPCGSCKNRRFGGT